MSQSTANYHIGRSSGICSATGESILPGQPYIASLCIDQEDSDGDSRGESGDDSGGKSGGESGGESGGGLVRVDYSLAAWESGQRPEHLFSYWKTVVPESNANLRPVVDLNVLMDLFERLGGDQQASRIALRFVLGLILMQKRRLKFVGRQGEGKDECWLLQVRGTGADGPPFEMINPHLNDDDVTDLTDQLGDLLQMEI